MSITPTKQESAADVVREILAGDALTLSAAASRLPHHRGKGCANPSTLWRWIVNGVRLPDGQRLHLEGARVGEKWLVSSASLERFVRRLTADARPEALSGRAQAEQQAAVAQADEELDRRGF
jgi:hypothetical protein